MEDIIYWVLGLYILPMVLNILFVYSDSEIKTIGDLMDGNWWGYFVPVLNILISIAIPIYYIGNFIENKFKNWWEGFKTTKIK